MAFANEVAGVSGRLREAHERLLSYYEIDRWHWRHDTPPLEICLGAILVQHTAWTNVEKALSGLREAGVDSVMALDELTEAELAALIRPAGTPSIKARRLKAFVELVHLHGGLEPLLGEPVEELRRLLLATYGIGPETADVICLYAAGKPVVVHDAYTARLCRRLGIGPQGDSYEDWRMWLEENLPSDLEYRRLSHAAVVIHCRETCRARPRCGSCPLADLCAFSQARET